MENKELKNRIKEIEETIKIKFENPNLLLESLIHPSFFNENPSIGRDNQRLEFLCDIIINIIISEALFKIHKDADEGLLSQMKSFLVKKETLAKKAKIIGLDKIIFLGKGEELQGGREKISILSDLFEAFIGALFLDKGFDYVKNFLLSLFKEDLERSEYEIDWKTLLRRHIQLCRKKLEYKLVKEEGPEHKKYYYVEVWIDEEKISEGIGKSKRQAEAVAAQKALEKIKNVS
jgi:ribonuclease-3